MLGLGWTEMLVVAALALIVVGPKDLPVMLRQLGRMVGTVRRMGNDFRREFNKMSAMDEIRDVRKSLTEPLRTAQADIQREFNKTSSIGTSPTGALKPDASGQSVVESIKTQAGIKPDHAAAKAEMAEAIAKSRAPVELEPIDVPSELAGKSIAGDTAKPKAARKPRAKSASAKSPGQAAEKPAAKPKTPARPAKPKSAEKPVQAEKPAKPASRRAAAGKTASAKPAPAKPVASKAAAAKPVADKAKPAAKPAAAPKAETKPAAKPAARKPRAAAKSAAEKAETPAAKPARRRNASKAEKN